MRRKETILIVDDIETNIDILNEILSYRYDIMVALDGKSALEVAKEKLPDLILLDIMMPQMDGYEVCKRLKENSRTATIPVIFNTARTDENSIEKAYSVGGIDYICKPFNVKEIKVRVEIQLRMKRVLKDLEKSKKQLTLLASIDPLTKIYNRRYFRVYSESIIKNMQKYDISLFIIMLDLDNFKFINDTYGHTVGDKVLVSISNTLKQISNAHDILCRYGGEEFVILAKRKSLDDAIEFAFNIKDEIAKRNIPINEKIINVTASIGVSPIYLNKEHNIEYALNRADEALFKVKYSTKNNVDVVL